MDSNQKNSSDPSLDQSNDALLDEAEALIWALFDNEIKPADIKRLEGLLKENEQVRQRYVSCVQMHADLHQHFGDIPAPPTTDSLPSSPVLGSLGNLQPGSGIFPPVVE